MEPLWWGNIVLWLKHITKLLPPLNKENPEVIVAIDWVAFSTLVSQKLAILIENCSTWISMRFDEQIEWNVDYDKSDVLLEDQIWWQVHCLLPRQMTVHVNIIESYFERLNVSWVE